MVDPNAAHHIDARTLLQLLPGVEAVDLPQLRAQFGGFLTSPAGRRCGSWQEAWNSFTGASQARPGQVSYRAQRCSSCHGRRYNVRTAGLNMARTGSAAVCGTCRGTGRGAMTRLPARWVPVPTS